MTLFGSIPPPDDGVWRRFGEKMHVDLSERSHFNRREKRVDTKVVGFAAMDAGMLSMAHYQGMDSAYDTRRYLLIAGDSDFIPCVSDILRAGLPVVMFAWSSGLAHQFYELASHSDGLLEIVILDNEELGYIQTGFNIDLHPIPHDRTFYMLKPAAAATSQDVAQRFSDTVQHLLKLFRRQGVYMYLYDTPGVPAVAFISHFGVTTRFYDSLLQFSSSHMQENGFADVRVLSHCAFSQISSRRREQAAASNFYTALPIFSLSESDASSDSESEGSEDGDSAANLSTLAVAETNEEGEDEGEFVFHVDRKRAAREQRRLDANRVGSVLCRHREFCPKGTDCKYNHLKEEVALFAANVAGHGKSPFVLRKYQMCPKIGSRFGCVAQSEKCCYRHEGEPALCIHCLEAPCIGCEQRGHQREPLVKGSKKYRELADKGYLRFTGARRSPAAERDRP